MILPALECFCILQVSTFRHTRMWKAKSERHSQRIKLQAMNLGLARSLFPCWWTTCESMEIFVAVCELPRSTLDPHAVVEATLKAWKA